MDVHTTPPLLPLLLVRHLAPCPGSGPPAAHARSMEWMSIDVGQQSAVSSVAGRWSGFIEFWILGQNITILS